MVRAGDISPLRTSSERSGISTYNYARFRFLSGAPCAAEIASALQAASGDAKVWNLAGMLAMRDKNYAHAAECFARAAEFAADPAAREAYRNNCRIAVESVRSAK